MDAKTLSKIVKGLTLLAKKRNITVKEALRVYYERINKPVAH